MTTYSGVLEKKVLALTENSGPSVYKLNFVLLVLVVLLTVIYIFLANFSVAQRYSLSFNKSKLNGLVANTVSKEAAVAANDVETLLLFAQKSGMVEAKDINSILQDNNFALTPPN